MAAIRKRTPKQASLLKVSLRGREVERAGAVPVPLLIEICKALQTAVTKQAELQAIGNISPEEYTLELVRLGKGSTVLEFELARSQGQLGQNGIGEKAIISLVGLIHELEGSDSAKELEPRPAAVNGLRAMARVVGPNLKVALHVPKERAPAMESATAVFNQNVAERVAEVMSKQNDFTPQIMEGIVEMADFKPSDHKFRLVPLYGASVTCSFEEIMSETVHALTRSVARVSGTAERDYRGKILSFRVDRIAPRGSPFPEGFGEKKTLAELIAEQKVEPIKTISELTGIWPEHEPKPN